MRKPKNLWLGRELDTGWYELWSSKKGCTDSVREEIVKAVIITHTKKGFKFELEGKR